MATLARLAGVSKNTISLALRGDPQISEKTRSRIVEIAQKAGYQKNATVARLMVELRLTRSPSIRSSLALLNANLSPAALRDHPTVPAYVRGCRLRATALGYGLDEFWLHDPELDGPRMNWILRARGTTSSVRRR